MKANRFMFILAFSLSISTNAQGQLKVYHGSNGETQVYDEADKAVIKPKIRMHQGEFVTVKVVNPNPLLYNYTLKYESISIGSDDKAITDLLATFNQILSTRAGATEFDKEKSAADQYKESLNKLIIDINDAKDYIKQSDKPELPEEALMYRRNAGLRYALDRINSMPNSQFRFNNSNLLSDLNTLSEKASVDDIEKKVFNCLNSSLVEKVNEIKKQTSLQLTQAIWQKEFKVTDSAQKVTLLITKIDKNNNTLIRDGNGDKEFQLEVGTIIPYYKRATLELVPVANFIFSNSVREFYLENNIVQNRLKPKTTVTAGIVLNVNFANFGESKEMSVGIGPGYKFNSAGDAFENFYLSALFSYRNLLRIGFGLGFAQFPTEELKGGGKVGEPLPANVSNLNDLLQFEEKPSAFLTISFTGLNLTKK